MSSITLIFPDQLFQNHPALLKERPVYLVEEYLFYLVQPFHKQRLILLRSAMKEYQKYLEESGFSVHYVDSSELKKRGDLLDFFSERRIHEIHLADFADDWLKQDLKSGNQQLVWYPSPAFLLQENELYSFFGKRSTYSMANFYAYYRKKFNILMEDGSPVGGKFSFDAENRKKLPKDLVIPSPYIPKPSSLVNEATLYVETNFPHAIGESSPFIYPTTFTQAKEALSFFLKTRLYLFGDYEDAIQQEESFLFHSVLSPLLNIGLLTPQQVLDEILAYHAKTPIPLNSLEGFIRQVMGWREFVRGCYVLRGKKQRSSNYFHHTHPLPKGFWDAKTGILPIDATIKRVLKTGYCHHIERLMILGNFLLLTESSPDAVYEWFMGYFVDAYDWVMVPNVYGMSQYADQDNMTTKPYISGSNYILKMSNYPKGPWVDIWDGLFWRFVKKHFLLFSRNPRTKVLVSLLEKNSPSIAPKIHCAENWLHAHR